MQCSPHLVEFAIGTILNELKGDVGAIPNSWKPQSTDVGRDTPLSTLTLVVGNSKLVAAVGGMEGIKRIRVGKGGYLDPDCEKRG